MKDVSGSVVVIMVPLPAQGHLNQLLELAYLVASHGIPVHYVGCASHNRQAKLRSHIPPSSSSCDVCFHNFPTPPFLSPAPNPNSTYKFPSHLQPAFDAASLLRGPVASLIRSLSLESRRVVVVHDSLMGSVVQDAALVPNAENYVFHSVSAFALYWYTWEATGRVLPREEEVDIAELLSSKGFPSLQVSFSNEFLKFIASQHDFKKLSSGSIYNTCRVVEDRYVDLFASATSNCITTKHWAIGPLNTVKVPEKSSRRSAHVCIKWLDKQAPSSVIYVSFGTTTALSDEQIREIAIGLERSGQKFIWVLREADKADIFSGGGVTRKIELPQGFEETVEARDSGMVVRDWAPQLEILGHPATGGFLSHCGWNSCMESISMGVPILAWPMHSDQPRNAVLITRVLKIGLIVKDWMSQDEVVESSTIQGAVKALMASEEGEETRKTAAELGAAVRGSMDEGGVSRAELDSFITHISR
ncbi:zeatin O-glucosyltransferase-like isoform X2 [Rhodamnia argentea]|uniref:Glycosyltransferase n=1 Tax=Rhodamnia argentea TaxID=178133 RepID=A0A8B8MYY0_9MYRT|nr:zeatin O-glucosyltransferase-like isoform X2 [Rhodamnia argentea]XP_048142017.1 zeatin O-glucosyltransferase-like isoform X1 [Rhodamnia argentea]XP_048142018.1 zeatin O-glucosyltransferase-like isoform X1 [Rhodamnia argentea]XP_048142019.1 zeatin O-glucosyltransferase-like isoform X1 [Rhodamnia argentea]XP_048142020.1 zeatin O-glucosyltransferase-like isoform X2 [Rhodamnia argentea]